MPALSVFLERARGHGTAGCASLIYSPLHMRRVAAVIAVVVLLIWAKVHFSAKPQDPTMEQMAEKLGRETRERMARQNQPATGLQIKETSTEAPAPTVVATPEQESPDEKAKARVDAMFSALQAKNEAKAALIWSAAAPNNKYPDYPQNNPGIVEKFKKFLSEHPVPENFQAYEIRTATYMDVNQYTTVDVDVNGTGYHLGVPDKGGPIFWTF